MIHTANPHHPDDSIEVCHILRRGERGYGQYVLGLARGGVVVPKRGQQPPQNQILVVTTKGNIMSTTFSAVTAQHPFIPDAWVLGTERFFGGWFNPNPEGEAGEMPIDDYVGHLIEVMATFAGDPDVTDRATSYYLIATGAKLQGAEKVQWG
jgi:hypothetical protein